MAVNAKTASMAGSSAGNSSSQDEIATDDARIILLHLPPELIVCILEYIDAREVRGVCVVQTHVSTDLLHRAPCMPSTKHDAQRRTILAATHESGAQNTIDADQTPRTHR
jgi:hypothetical protein